jgi:GTP-binding protein HflX
VKIIAHPTKTHTTIAPRPKAFLVGAEWRRSLSLLRVEDSLTELARLADTAGLDVVGQAFQRFENPHQATFIGPGKVEEVKALAEDAEATIILFDDELSPRHQRELEKVFGKQQQVLDRTALILDIFAQHAQTREGMLQVELAQLEYRLPRLTRMWTHLARQTGSTGGSVGVRGPGETQIELDRRMIGQRISLLKAELEQVRAHRRRHRQKRQQTELQVVAIVGYTNAGKSTLLNRLSGADVLSADMLFATLDPTTRKMILPGGREVLFTDTVGFIQKLPTDIVAAFRATLEEITEADIILHVADATHPNMDAQIEAVMDTLAELEVDHLPMILALNKTDGLEGPLPPLPDGATNMPAVPISALTGAGLPELMVAIEAVTEQIMRPVTLHLPYERGDLLSLFHERGQVETITHQADGVQIIGRLPRRLLPIFTPWNHTPSPQGEAEHAETPL